MFGVLPLLLMETGRQRLCAFLCVCSLPCENCERSRGYLLHSSPVTQAAFFFFFLTTLGLKINLWRTWAEFSFTCCRFLLHLTVNVLHISNTEHWLIVMHGQHLIWKFPAWYGVRQWSSLAGCICYPIRAIDQKAPTSGCVGFFCFFNYHFFVSWLTVGVTQFIPHVLSLVCVFQAFNLFPGR